MASQTSSAEIERTTAEIDVDRQRRQALRRPRHGLGDPLRRLPQALRGGRRRRRRRGRRAAGARARRQARPARDRGRSSISPSRRPATPRRRSSRRWRSSASAAPRPMPRRSTCCATANMCASTRSGFIPEDKGRLVTAFLESFFSRYVEYDFTADLEEKLDLISAGKLEWKDVLRDFWRDFIAAVNDIEDLRIAEVLEALNELLGPHIFPETADGGDPRTCPSCATGQLELKVGKFGAFIGCSNYPECRFTRQLADSGDKPGDRRRRQAARHRSRDRARRHAAHRPLRTLCPARRGERQGREAETRLDPQGHRARQSRSRAGAEAARAAARDRRPSGDRQADPRRLRPLRALRPA